MRELEGRIAVVTGGARGIGKAICQTLAGEGARVAVCDVDYEASRQTVEEMKDQGLSAFAVKLDVSSGREVKKVFGKIIDDFGKVDILVNNAGICYYVPFEKITEEEWDRVLAVNLKGTFLCCQAVMHSMMAQRWGKIVNISSVAAKIGGILAGAHYSASKAGVIAFTKSLAKEVSGRGITVNCVAPGFIETRMTGVFSEEEKRNILSQIPCGRLGKPEDVAWVVAFLCSDYAFYVNGEVINVSGGLYM